MREACYCGRVGGIEDRVPVLRAGARWVMRCPECGHDDDLRWLPDEEALLLWGEARHRHEGSKREAA